MDELLCFVDFSFGNKIFDSCTLSFNLSSRLKHARLLQHTLSPHSVQLGHCFGESFVEHVAQDHRVQGIDVDAFTLTQLWHSNKQLRQRIEMTALTVTMGQKMKMRKINSVMMKEFRLQRPVSECFSLSLFLTAGMTLVQLGEKIPKEVILCFSFWDIVFC